MSAEDVYSRGDALKANREGMGAFLAELSHIELRALFEHVNHGQNDYSLLASVARHGNDATLVLLLTQLLALSSATTPG